MYFWGGGTSVMANWAIDLVPVEDLLSCCSELFICSEMMSERAFCRRPFSMTSN